MGPHRLIRFSRMASQSDPSPFLGRTSGGPRRHRRRSLAPLHCCPRSPVLPGAARKLHLKLADARIGRQLLSQHGDLGRGTGGVSNSLGGCAPLAFTGKFTLKLADAGYKRLDINRATVRFRFCYRLRAMLEAVTPQPPPHRIPEPSCFRSSRRRHRDKV